MMKRMAIGGLVALVLAACQGEAGNGSPAGRDQVRAVGSSTVYPFATAVAEQFARNTDFKAAVVESTGTGAGFNLFCAGVGANHPDIINASRRMKKSEYELCEANGVAEVVELEIGIDGITLGESMEGEPISLTPEDVYKALAANPHGEPNTARTWRDVNPALPDTPIRVLGPPPTSGTRDALVELILDPGCNADPAMKALKDEDAERHKNICTQVRSDGAYVDSGENDNLIVQKLVADPQAIGIFGYSFLEANGDRIRGVALSGVTPTYESISSYSYPGARPLYIYVKKAHLDAIPGLKEFVAEFVGAWGPEGYLKDRGLIVGPEEIRTRNAAIAAAFTPLDPATLE